jgi:S-adenosylmethionine:tRNA-ribosyltransferase-isomerase (queuine synthetase)
MVVGKNPHKQVNHITKPSNGLRKQSRFLFQKSPPVCYARCWQRYMHKEYQTLFNKLILVSLIVFLSACGATQPPPYQKDKKPEDRDQYNGVEGMAQQQKDQNYLMSKELSDKCTEAKIDLAIAQTDKNTNEIEKQNALISSTCI